MPLKPRLLALLVALTVARAAAADGPLDTVKLAGGGRLQGTVVVDEAPGDLVIRLVDGTIRKVKRGTIASVEYGAAQTSPAAAQSHAGAAPAQGPVIYLSSSPSTPPGHAPPTYAPPGAAPPPYVSPGYVYPQPGYGAPAYVTPEFGAPPGSHVERRNLRSLWITGLIIDLGMWAIRAGVTEAICASYTSTENGCDGTDTATAAVPLVGAWIGLSKGSDPTAHGLGSGNAALLVGDGILEAGGFAMLIAGLSIHHDVVVDGPGPRESEDALLHVGPLRVLPAAGPRSVALLGAF